MATEVVLDSSAVIALLGEEDGFEAVAARMRGAAMSVVNACEVGDYVIRRGGTRAHAAAALAGLRIAILSPDLALALDAAAIHPETRRAGLSLGDCFCLALAKRLQRPALSGDRDWLKVADRIGVKVELFR